MAGVEQIRAGIAVATEKSQAAVAAIVHASLEIDDARAALLTGGGHPGLAEALDLLADAQHGLDAAQGTLRASMTSAEGCAARL
ncbi:hypothetical protein [Actinokineospora sp. NBRC 105648]|uniref:hypothetical protein n=1 Tax=Actinokineospora sp. NBRC 105648 TaxID=3032206 RepID=UPI0024A56B5E|nr:hypothetical protein [Actinokineospora sp. NBRC 105648]GLZ41905.1 hypothetical protein Acsp05_55290 [Actinokineospora sp. NBRC 105648]